jgi:hypothetical protein
MWRTLRPRSRDWRHSSMAEDRDRENPCALETILQEAANMAFGMDVERKSLWKRNKHLEALIVAQKNEIDRLSVEIHKTHVVADPQCSYCPREWKGDTDA